MEQDGSSSNNNNVVESEAEGSSSPMPDDSSPVSNEPSSVPKESSPKHANVFQRFAALFSKTSPHHVRNRWILAICMLALAGVIAVVVVFLVLPSLVSGKISILNIIPTDINDDILDANSHFIVTTENGSVDKLKNALYLEPAIDYDVKELTPGTSYEIIPTSELSDNI